MSFVDECCDECWFGGWIVCECGVDCGIELCGCDVGVKIDIECDVYYVWLLSVVCIVGLLVSVVMWLIMMIVGDLMLVLLMCVMSVLSVVWMWCCLGCVVFLIVVYGVLLGRLLLCNVVVIVLSWWMFM